MKTREQWRLKAGADARREVLGDRGLRWAVAIAALWVCVFGVLCLLLGAETRAGMARDYVLAALPSLANAVLAGCAARRSLGRTGWFWATMALSASLVAAGNLLDGGQEFVWEPRDDVGVLTTALYLAAALLLIPAIALGPGRAWPLRSVRALVDASLLPVALAFAAWTFVVAPRTGALNSIESVAAMAFPFIDAIVLGLLVTVLVGARGRTPVWMLAIAAGLALAALGDVGYSYGELHDSAPDDRVINLLFQANLVLVGIGAVAALRGRELPPAPDPAVSDGGLVLVLAGSAVAAATLVTVVDLASLPIGAAPVTLFAACVLLGRVVLTSREQIAIRRKLSALLAEREREAITDPLTGLYNRRLALTRLDEELARTRRSHAPVAIALIDLDHFKHVNDSHGHATGDKVLSEAASRLAGVVRGTDVLARFGGEEFLVIAPNTDGSEAHTLAERLRIQLAGAPIETEGGPLTVTASIGVAVSFEDHIETPALLVAADEALYEAKAAGRNRTVCAR